MQLLKTITLPLLVSLFILTSCQGSEDPTPAVTLVANAGIDQELNIGQTVTLDGSQSKTTDGKALQYAWTFTKMPANSKAVLSGADGIKPTFVPDLAGEYEIVLTVSNGTATKTDNVVVVVKYQPLVLQSITVKTVLVDRVADPTLADYWVNEDIGVDAELLVMPGVVIGFAEDAMMYINDQGTLISKGQSDRKIVFTTKAGVAGKWRGIVVYSGNSLNELSYTEILKAGSIDAISNVPAAITVAQAGRLTIKNSKVSESKGYGIHFMDGSLIGGFQDNTLSNNGNAPVRLTANHVAKLDAASSFSTGNARNVIEVMRSTLTGSSEVAWPAFTDKTPYLFSDVITINTGWRLNSGTTIEVAPDTYFEIGDGYIKAVGTTDQHIRITGADKSKSSWSGMVIYSRSNFNVMEYVDVEYAGDSELISGVKASITVTSAGSLSMRNSKILDSGGYGIFINGGDVVVNDDVQTANEFVGMVQGSVYRRN